MLPSAVPFLILFSLIAPAFSTTITSTITLVVARPTAASASDSSQYTSDDNFRQAVLNSTNKYRDQHNASALTWNETLVSLAADYASKCLWKHSHGSTGENLAEGYLNVTSAIEAWGNERTKYDFGHMQFSKSTGHFTQLVWKATKSVGCARVNCKGGYPDAARGWFIVCEYYPGGNVEGMFKEEVQKQLKQKSHASSAMNHRMGLAALVSVLIASLIIGLRA